MRAPRTPPRRPPAKQTLHTQHGAVGRHSAATPSRIDQRSGSYLWVLGPQRRLVAPVTAPLDATLAVRVAQLEAGARRPRVTPRCLRSTACCAVCLHAGLQPSLLFESQGSSAHLQQQHLAASIGLHGPGRHDGVRVCAHHSIHLLAHQHTAPHRMDAAVPTRRGPNRAVFT